MKLLITCMLFALSAIANTAVAQDFSVTKTVRSTPLSLSDITIKNLKLSATPLETLGASASFELTSQYSSGWCWIQDLAVQKTFVDRTGSDSENLVENYDVRFMGIETRDSKPVSLVSSGCAGGSSGTLTLPFDVEIKSWGKAQKTMSFRYKFISRSVSSTPEESTVLTVVYDIDTGWSYSVKSEI